MNALRQNGYLSCKNKDFYFIMKYQLSTVQRLLRCEFTVCVTVTVLLVLIFETSMLQAGVFATDVLLSYYLLILQELVTVCCLPLALKMFKTGTVRNRLRRQGTKALALWGALRMAMIGLPVVVNTLLYYMSLSVAYAYLAVIGVICLAFVYPSMARCAEEIGTEE